MKRAFAVSLALACLVVSLGSVNAEELILFSGADGGADAWVWGAARVRQTGEGLLISEKNPEAEYGDAFVADRFPFAARGRVELDVVAVTGTYTLQALAFQGDAYMASVDVVQNSSDMGLKSVGFDQFEFPAATDHVMFKMWVGGQEGAHTTIRDLRYVFPVEGRILLDKRFDAMTGAEPDHARWSPGPEGGVVTLSGEQDYGSVLLTDFVQKPSQGSLMMDAIVSNGTITAQLVIFDSNRDYIDSMDAIARAGSGISMARLDTFAWPAEAAYFQLKLWLGGMPDCSARIRRIVVVD